MSERTPRLGLPYILPGQAQKELFHNEALALIDVALNAAVEGDPVTEPPPSPSEGQCWAVDAGASGSFGGKAGGLAMWTASGWRFSAPNAGTNVWNKASGYPMRWDGSAWTGGELAGSAFYVNGVKVVGEQRPAPPSPSGGTIIDTEARSSLNALIATLKSHGLIS
jgi:hypothetical protein